MAHARVNLQALLLLVVLLAPAGPAPAHGGGLDARGGHTDRRTGRYHCHRPPCSTETPADARAASVPALPALPAPLDLEAAPEPRKPDLCPLGPPRHEQDLGPTVVVAREGYVLEHSSKYKVPLWVCQRVEAEQVHGAARRRDRFAPDPELEGHPRAELADYRGSGYDRGHLAPAGDYARDQDLKDSTFYLSNMAPQDPDMNRRIWRRLESLVREWSEAWGAVWVVTGAMFYEAAEEDPARADGVVEVRTIGAGQVAVPTHFYKIVVREDPGGVFDVVGFTVENEGYPTPYDFDSLTRSIDWIEAHTGLDFLPDLDPAVEPSLEGERRRPWSRP